MPPSLPAASDALKPPSRGARRRGMLARRRALHSLTILISLAAIVGAFVSLAIAMRLSSQASAAVEVSYRAIGAATTLQSTLQDIETGQRGYLLTGQASFLQPYEAALARMGAERQALAAEARGPDQRALLRVVERRIDEKLDLSARSIALVRAGRTADARALVASGAGKNSMDRVRAAFGAFLGHEREMLGRRRAARAAAVDRAQLLALLGALLTLAAAGIAVAISTRTTGILIQRAGEAARERRRFRSTFDKAAIGIAHLSPQGIVLRANAQLCEITGYTQDQLVGDWFETITHTDDVPAELASRRSLLMGERERYASEYRCIRPDGSSNWVSATVSLVRDGRGEPDFFVSVVKDITDRKHAEAQLLSGEAQYRAIYDSAVEAIAVIDAAGYIQSVNPAATRVFGYEAEEMIGRNVKMLMPGAMAHAHDGFLDRYRQTGKRAIIGIGREVEGLRKDGTVFPLDLSVAEWRSGGETFFTGTMRDITERKLAQQALAQGEARFRLTLEAVHAGNWETDLITLRTTLSREGMRLFGLSGETEGNFGRGELTARADPVDAQRMRVQFDRAVAEGKRLDAVMRIQWPDGSSHWVQLIGQPQYDSEGRAIRMTGLSIDVTDRRQTELALRESEASLRSLQNEFAHLARVNELGELAAAIAHEINQPLTAITNYMNVGRYALDVLGAGKGDVDAARIEASEVIELAGAQALRAGEIVRRLRAFVAKGSGARQPEKIDDIVDTAMALSLVDAQLAGIIVDRHRGASEALVEVEAIQIQQVLVNLLRNAIDALVQMPGSAVRQLTIATRLVDAGNMVEVMVRDTGRGILPELMARLFEPFVTSKPHGMGMGLSLSRRLIEAHGGTIEVESEAGHGATFRFTLPVFDPDRCDG